jgi:hypothetical protein
MAVEGAAYPARLTVDYPERLDRLTTLLRPLWAIPILIVILGIEANLWLGTGLMIIFRRRYPRWWFDFAREFARFETRVGAYMVLVTDRYPSTEDEQSVHLDIDYPDAERDLNRWLPIVKWLLAIPHIIVLVLLAVVAMILIIISWVAILITGRCPRGIFDFLVGVARWSLRVNAYAVLLVTDRYPPFSLD